MSELAFNRVILEKNNQILSIVLIVSIAINLILGAVNLININKPPLVIFKQDSKIEAMDYEIYKVNETVLIDFVRMISKDYLSFRFESLPDQIKQIEKYLLNQPLQSILHSHKKSEGRLSDKQIIQQFDIESIEIVKTNNPYHVDVKGVKNIFVDGMYKSLDSVYAFEVKEVRPNQKNPYGLLIAEVLERSVDENVEESK